MAQMFTLGFEFEGVEYFSIILQKDYEEERQYKITVMNGRLQNLLFDSNIIKEINGGLKIGDLKNEREKKLKLSIAQALSRLLNKPIDEESAYQGVA